MAALQFETYCIGYRDARELLPLAEAILSMPTISPLQIVLVRHPDDLDAHPFEDAIAKAFQGGMEAGGYLATGEDLGIQLEIFARAPRARVSQLLDSFCHTLVVVVLDHDLLNKGGSKLWKWLEQCWSFVEASHGRHAMLIVPLDERLGNAVSKMPGLGNLQLLHVYELGERAIRPAMLALRLVHESRILLAGGLYTSDPKCGHLTLFISHAKMDGLPLAHALKHQIKNLPWLRSFYDVDDIPPGSNWQTELENGVSKSLIIILRTEAYDSRPWCQQEVLWADEYATPAVLVDARTNLNHPAAKLPLDRIPTVRIPDGNLIRILYLALREDLRHLLFARLVEQMKSDRDLPTPIELFVFCFQPSMSALLRACAVLSRSTAPATTTRMILYPDPPYRAGLYEAATALVRSYVPSARLVTPQTIAATSARVK